MVNRVQTCISFFFLMLTLCVSVSSVRASQNIEAGDAIFIDVSNREKIGLRVVDDTDHLVLTNDLIIDVSDKDAEAVENAIKTSLPREYKLQKIVFYPANDLIRVTVLGDISNPGNYQVPVNSNLQDLNKFTALYDQQLFESSITVVRRGKRHVVTTDELSWMSAQVGDILLLSLNKKPQPIITKAVDPAPEIKLQPVIERVLM